MRNDEYRIGRVRAQYESQHIRVTKMLNDYGHVFDGIIASMPTSIISAYVDSDGDFRISVSGDKHIFASAIRAFRIHGLKTTEKAPDPKTAYWSAWFYGEGAVRERMKVLFSFSSTVCRRVKVGEIEKTVKEDVYETVCGEMELPR
jgi:hypothetical protein